MKFIDRILLVLFLAGYGLLFYRLLITPHLIERITSGIVSIIIEILIALIIGGFIWVTTGKLSKTISHYVLKGGKIFGITLFIIGFVGPILVMPNASLGPLLGIFITGPLGFIFGLIAGGFYGIRKEKKIKNVASPI